MAGLQGKVVLIDFWTYSCVNCIRTQPHLNEWYQKYADQGLVIIGVHTPEFDFEKIQANVEQAVSSEEIKYPVVLDPDYKIWNLFANRWWPRKFLIDHKGYIVYDHVGEGAYAETEMEIQQALSQIGAKNLPPVKPDTSVGGGICYRTTPETYLGFVRGRFGNAEHIEPGQESAFDNGNEHEEDLVYLHGHWTVTNDSLAHTRALSAPTEYLLLKYSAFSVNLVMRSIDGRSATLEIDFDGQPLPADMAGEDVNIGKDGKATVTVKGARMYRLVNATTYHRGTLKLKTGANNLECFAFTFGGCEGM
jgi:thiol-disulfide isomerase/thioredoxin